MKGGGYERETVANGERGKRTKRAWHPRESEAG